MSTSINNLQKYFFSKEPGYYEDEQFGIRLENIFIVKEVETTVNMIKVL